MTMGIPIVNDFILIRVYRGETTLGAVAGASPNALRAIFVLQTERVPVYVQDPSTTSGRYVMQFICTSKKDFSLRAIRYIYDYLPLPHIFRRIYYLT